jgi:YidC/Oxa1 family membrane protein insertase
MGLWSSFIDLLNGILSSINSVVGVFGISVIIFTLFIRLILLPLDLKSKQSMKRMSDINPEIQRINEKYKNDAEKKNKKIQELYQKNNVNPLGGCLPMLIQMPLFFAFFAALRNISEVETAKFLTDLLYSQNSALITLLPQITDIVNAADIGQSMAQLLPQLFKDPSATKIIENLTSVVAVSDVTVLTDTIKSISVDDAMMFLKTQYAGNQFLWIKNIFIADSPILNIMGQSISPFTQGFNGAFILSALAGLTSYYQMKLTSTQQSAQQNEQAKMMQMIFPFMSVFFTATYTAAFGVYWVTSNVFQITQQLIYNKVIANKDTEATVIKGVKQ